MSYAVGATGTTRGLDAVGPPNCGGIQKLRVAGIAVEEILRHHTFQFAWDQ